MLDRVRLSLLFTGTVLQSAILAGGAAAQDASETALEGSASVLDTILVRSNAPDAHDTHQGAADRANAIYVSREDIERTNPQDLKDLFAVDPSISVGGAIPVTQKVFVNGIDENNLAVTIDGVQQGNRIFHHVNTNYIDPSLLKAARVDPGVAPADAGFSALGGSIVYETVDVQDLLIGDRNFGAFADVSYETNGKTFTETGSAYGRHGGFELLAYGKLANGEDYKDGDGNTVVGSSADFYSLLGKAAYEADNGYRIELTAQQVSDDTLRPYRANIGAINGVYTTRRYDIKRTNFSFNVNRAETEGLWNPELLVGYSGNDNRVPEPYGSEGSGGTWNAKIENVFQFSEGNTLTTGVDLLSQVGDYTDPAESYQESVTNTGAYVQARLTPIERIRLSFGGRADANRFEGKDDTTLTNYGLSGNAFAEVDVYGGFSVNAGYSNVFGGIDLEETFEYWRSWDYDNLKPVRAENVTAGVKFEQGGWFAEGNVFNTQFSNYRDGDQNVDFSSWGYNVGGGYNWGSGFAKVAYSDVRLSVSNNQLESYYLINIGAGVGQKISAEVAQTFDTIDLTVGATVDAALEYDGYVSAGYDPLDAYTVVNAYAEYKPKQFEYLSLRLDALNLFDETYADRATYGQEYDSVTPLYEPGRSFRLSARLRY